MISSRSKIRSVTGVLVVLYFVTAALRPAPAYAHAELMQSDPPAQAALTRAPAQVQLLFTEAVEPRSIEVSVLDRDRRRVDRDDARLLPGTNDTVVLSLGDLPPGTYTIAWKVTSAIDGHTTRGRVPFSVGDPGEVPGPLSAAEIGRATSGESGVQKGPVGVAARWLVLLSMLTLGGVIVAGPLLLRPAAHRLESLRAAREATAVTDEAPARVTSTALRRMRRLCWIALALFAAASVLLLIVDAAAFADTSLPGAFGPPIVDVLGSRRGVLWLIRSGLAILLAVGLFAGQLRRGEMARPVVWWAMAALVAAMLLATSLSSHSAALRTGTAVATAIDWVHLLAAAVWIGGLIFLALALLPSLGPLAGPARTHLLAYLVPRFSTVAVASVAVIVLTGAYQTWRLLGGLRALTEIDWGRSLLVKLALVVLLLGLGAFNLLVVRPRLAVHARRLDRATRERAARLRLAFRRVVLAEAVLGALVVLVVGVLTGLVPSRVRSSVPEGPFRPFILDARAEDLAGQLVLAPGRIGNNRFDLTVRRQDGGPLARDASVVLRITTLDQETGTTEAPMEPLGAGRFTTTGAYLSTVGLWQIAAVVRRPGHDDATLTFALSLTEATGRPQVQENRPAAPLARGRELYQQNCTQCHGVAGRGDGPLAAGLRPPPLDLTVHVPLHSDGELANWITNGIPRTSMPAFGSQFSPEEIQAVVNYLRELARQSGQDR